MPYLLTTSDDSGYEVFSQEYPTKLEAIREGHTTLAAPGYTAVVEDLDTGDVVWSDLWEPE